jgi:hypothetical protein
LKLYVVSLLVLPIEPAAREELLRLTLKCRPQDLGDSW